MTNNLESVKKNNGLKQWFKQRQCFIQKRVRTLITELCWFQWVANPVNDMYADAVLAVILQVESNPTTAQGDSFFFSFDISRNDS